VVLAGIEALTACNPSWNCSRVIVNFIPSSRCKKELLVLNITKPVVAVGSLEMWTIASTAMTPPYCAIYRC
jgi:hypothetical protein